MSLFLLHMSEVAPSSRKTRKCGNLVIPNQIVADMEPIDRLIRT